MLPQTLQPLEPHKNDILVLGNLTHNTGRALLDGAGDHGRCCGSYLTGVQVKKIGQRHQGQRVDATSWSPIRSASRRGFRRSKWGSKTGARRATAIPAIRARTPTTWRGAARRSRCRRFSIRARSSSGCSATARSSRPRRARSGGINRRSILDFITEDTRALHGSLGPTDQRKLDEYLELDPPDRRAVEARRAGERAGRSRHGEALRHAERLRRALQADDRHDHGRVPGRPDARRHVPRDARRHVTRLSRDRHPRRPPSADAPPEHRGADGQGREDQPVPDGAVREVGRRS